MFCKIARGELPCYKIWEDEKHLAFLSIFPNTEGFSVVIPKKHYSSYAFDLSEEVLKDLVIAAKKVGKLIDSKLEDVGRTGMIFEGFGVDHVHAKLFPMHGTAKDGVWKQHSSNINKFFEEYEGYISSHDGDRADDEKLVEGTKTELRIRKSMTEIALLQKTVPAPLKQRHLCSLMAFQLRGVTHRPDVAEFYDLALEEVRNRVEDGIAACGNEEFRLFHEGSLPWFSKLGDLLRYPEKVGGVYIGSLNNFGLTGNFTINQEGQWQSSPFLRETGAEIKSRDDAFETLAETNLLYSPFCQLFQRPEYRLSAALDCLCSS